MIETSTLRRLRFAVGEVQDKLAKGAGYEAVKSSLEAIPALLRPSEASEHTLPEIVAEARHWAEQEVAGVESDEIMVYTGLPQFDKEAGGIYPHEYVVLGARTSTGKSSFCNQIASHNLNRGLRVAIFTLETSARSVVMQIAAQRTDANLRQFRFEMKQKQQAYLAELARIQTQPLMVFDRELTLDKIEARCRLLAASFKPNLVIIDYLGLIKTKGDGAYERMTTLSKAMIPLKKTLGCTLLVAAQLNRGNEKDDRPPARTDFRDTGSIEEDSHRLLCLHRPSKDESGMLQGYGKAIYHSEIYQLKLRDGPLAQGRLDFYSGCTKFVEKQ
jgi:replicative DNA helicase